MSTRQDDKIKLEFIINGDQARKTLNDIDNESYKIKQNMKGMKKGSEEYIAANKRLNEITAQQAALRKEIGLTSLSLRELNKESRRLRAIRDNLIPGTAKFKQIDKQLQAVNARMRELRTGSAQAGVSLSSMANGFNKYFGVIAGATASFAGLIMGARKAIDEFNNFEQRLANLSALTGLVGEELQWLGSEAALMATSTIEGNVRIRQSADAILDAYTKVGSQRPELLKNKEALAAVTQDALILAEAGNMELGPAVSAVTTTLNQMNMQATESRRVINAIAAGSKAGAADIPYLTAAMEKAGTTANLLGLSVEQVVGAIETVAPYYSQAEMAGNSLDKVMLRMRANNIGFVDGIFSLEAAMSELEHRFRNGETSVDIFGVEHAKMAEVLVANRHEFNRYTEAVTGSNVAIEQASINTDTNMAKLEQARNRYRENLRELGGMIAPVMTLSTNFFSSVMKIIVEIAKNWDKYRQVMIALIATYIAYNAQALISLATTAKLNTIKAIELGLLRSEVILTKTATAGNLLFAAAKALIAGNTSKATAAMVAFRAATIGTPWGLIAAGVTAVSSAIYLYSRRKKEAVKEETVSQRIAIESRERYAEEAARVNILTGTIENNNLSLKNRRNAIDKLKQIIPEYNASLSNEGKLIGHNTTQINAYLKSVENRIKLAIYEEKLKLAHLDHMNAKGAFERGVERWGDSEINVPDTEILNVHQLAVRALRFEYEDAAKALDSLNKEYGEFSIEVATLEPIEKNNNKIKEASELHDILKKRIADTEKAMADLSIVMRNTALDAMATGDFSALEKMQGAMAAIKMDLDNLKADDIILTGIANTGSIDAFLDSLDDIDAELLEDQAERNAQFLKMWGNAKVESAKETNARLLDVQLEAGSKEQMIDEDRKRDREEREQKHLEKIKELTLQSASDITRGLADIWFMHERSKTDSLLAELEDQKQRTLANTSLTEQQKEVIENQYRQREAQIKRRQFQREKAASIIESLINTAVAVTKVLHNPFLVASASIAGAMQTAVIAAQPVPQFAKGRYQVKGRDDNRTYDVPYIGRPQTGYYSRPALFAETGGEIIIDPFTTRNIMANHPAIMNAIMAARVPQYSSGKNMDAMDGIPEHDSRMMMEYVQMFGRYVEQLTTQGIDARISMTNFQREYEKYQEIKRGAKRS
jgi:TP901 family phage tail tape measure protein